MNDELERLILNNRRSFEDDEPLEGHFGRFEARLQKAAKPSPIARLRPIFRIAAIVVFALLAVNQARLWFTPDKKDTLSLGSISPQYREVEFYYTTAIQTDIKQLTMLENEGLISDSEKQMFEKEQKEFDQMYLKLLEDLKANPDDERVINAMLEYYQSRMNVLSMIVTKLKEVKQHKRLQNEMSPNGTPDQIEI